MIVERKPRVTGPSTLHVALTMDEATAPYNQHCLPLACQRHIGICTYWEPGITPPPHIPAFNGGGTFLGFIRALRRALESHPYDILHTHNPHLGALLSVMRVLFGKRWFPPLVITVRSSYSVARVKHRLMYLPTFALFDSIICCGNASLSSFPGLYRWLGGKRLSAIQNGINLSRVDEAPVVEKPRSFTALTVARLVPVKNLSTAIRAAHACKDPTAMFILVGEGPLRSALTKEVEELGVQDRVQFTGLLPRDEALSRMKSSDLFVSTSLGEGLPVAVLEAMACRLPVILSDIPPHREIAQGSSFIPLVPPNDPDGFKREIERFQGMPQEERHDIGRKCRKIIEERFDLWRMLSDYDREYSRVSRAWKIESTGGASG